MARREGHPFRYRGETKRNGVMNHCKSGERRFDRMLYDEWRKSGCPVCPNLGVMAGMEGEGLCAVAYFGKSLSDQSVSHPFRGDFLEII